MGVGVNIHVCLDLDSSWRWVVSFTPLPLYLQGKSPTYPLNRGLGSPTVGVDNMEGWKFLALPGPELRTLGHPAHSQSLYRAAIVKCLKFNLISSRYPKSCSRLLKFSVIQPISEKLQRLSVVNSLKLNLTSRWYSKSCTQLSSSWYLKSSEVSP
jgi:hypothetical protein